MEQRSPKKFPFDLASFGPAAIEKAKELFLVCDKEDKGFIIRRDMLRLQDELGLTPEQLAEVFESLDADGSGFLTMEEFIDGFSAFLGLQLPTDIVDGEELCSLQTNDKQLVSPEVRSDLLINFDDVTTPQAQPQSTTAIMTSATATATAAHSSDLNIGSLDRNPRILNGFNGTSDDEEQFYALVENLGLSDVLKDHDAVKQLWIKLKQSDQSLVGNFEDFLVKVSSHMRRTQEDFTHIETVLRQKSTVHDEEVRRLYEEVENQVRIEKEKVAKEEREKAMRLKSEMEKELEEKDHQLQDILSKQRELERKLSEVNSVTKLTDKEKQKLEKERLSFVEEKSRAEMELEETRRTLSDAKEQLEELKRKAKEEKRERAKQALKVSESIASERETLVQQMDALRAMNKQLKDARDENMLKHLQTPVVPPPIRKASSLGGYSSSYATGVVSRGSPLAAIADELESDCEVDDEFHTATSSNVNVGTSRTLVSQHSLLYELEKANNRYFSREAEKSPSRCADRVGPVGEHSPPPTSSKTQPSKGFLGEKDAIERLFKVVFVGDSGVGKTCFLHRFCHNKFIPTFSATIGVDFQVRSMRIQNRNVVLQLWDTAGQERFRSITKQYFRKADGVVLMYDVTSELSFINLRNWMNSVKEGVDDSCVICLVGNKIDLVPDDAARVLKYKDGQRLADEFGTLFYEVSAQTGETIYDCMEALAVLLSDREDQQLEKVLKLEMEVEKKKSRCCGSTQKKAAQ